MRCYDPSAEDTPPRDTRGTPRDPPWKSPCHNPEDTTGDKKKHLCSGEAVFWRDLGALVPPQEPPAGDPRKGPSGIL